MPSGGMLTGCHVAWIVAKMLSPTHQGQSLI